MEQVEGGTRGGHAGYGAEGEDEGSVRVGLGNENGEAAIGEEQVGWAVNTDGVVGVEELLPRWMETGRC